MTPHTMSNADTLFRQWQMLRLIPRYPRRISTQQLHRALADAGFHTTDRTVSRDLDALSTIFGYTCDEDGRAKLWFWPGASQIMDIPGMEPHAALAWAISEADLRQRLPSSSQAHLRPYFERAQAVLENRQGTARWKSLFHVIPVGPARKPPRLRDRTYDTVCTALIDECCLDVTYRARSTGQTRSLTLHPQALVLRDDVHYLVAMAGNHENPVHFALHRMHDAKLNPASRKRCRKTDIKRYVDESFRYPASTAAIELVLRVTADVAQHLDERPLGAGQVIHPPSMDGGRHTVTTQCADTAELRWWILSMGPGVEVVEPITIRSSTLSALSEALSQYAPTAALPNEGQLN